MAQVRDRQLQTVASSTKVKERKKEASAMPVDSVLFKLRVKIALTGRKKESHCYSRYCLRFASGAFLCMWL